MEPFIVSARKYRPETFEDVVGQSAITKTLEKAIEDSHLSQALLFTGPRGVGKTTCARILAKKINQQSGEFGEDEDFAFNIFELDAASNNGVDQIREIVNQVRIPPQVGKYKIYIIDEVHMLSNAAFNAFLKTLEEPPAHVIFILATTEKHKIIPTILSRCQIFDFKRITVSDMRDHLQKIAIREGIEADQEALHIIAQKADGALRDSLSIFDRVVSYSGKNLTVQAVTENLNVLDRDTFFKMTDLILENNIPQLLVEYDVIMDKGFEGQHFISGLASHFRDLMVCKDARTIPLLEVGDVNKEKYLTQSKKTDLSFLQRAVHMANDTDNQYRTSRNPRLLIEICLMQLASITADGEKKNDLKFILPAVYFINHNITPAAILAHKNTTTQAAVKLPESNTSNVKPVTETGTSLEKNTELVTALTASSNLLEEPATLLATTAVPVNDVAVQETNDLESIRSIEQEVEEELAQQIAPPPTLLEVPAIVVEEPVEDDLPEIEMAFDFDLDLDAIEILDNPVVSSRSLNENTIAPADQTQSQKDTSTSNEPPAGLVEKSTKELPTTSIAAVVEEPNANDLIKAKRDALLAKGKQQVSRYSIGAIEAKNKLESATKSTVLATDDLPHDTFTPDQVISLWNSYYNQLQQRGDMILASIMNIDTPVIKDNSIVLRFPNQSMKEDLENAKGQILNYIRKELNNYSIDLDVHVDISVQKKYVYTDQDKFEKLVEKNPAVALLRKTFDLDF